MAGRFTKLVPATIQALKVGEALREQGIFVEKLPGDARWTVGFMHHGVRVHRVLGLSSAGWTRLKCEAWVEERKAELRDDVRSLPAGRKTRMRFAELADWYVAELEATGGRNLSNKRPQIEHRLRPFFGTVIVEALTEDLVGRYRTTQLAAGLSASTINRDLATLCHIFTTATRLRKIGRAPCRIVKLTEPAGRIIVLSHDEVSRLRRAASEDAFVWLFVEIALGTGMRASEIVRARFDQIDWANRRLFIPKAKAGGRHQPLSEHLVAVLKREWARRGDGAWIFPAQGRVPEKARPYAFNKQFRRVVAAAGLDPTSVTPHVMRHTVITRLVEAGVALPTVQQISGHKTLGMVMRYTHVSSRTVDAAMEVLDGLAPSSGPRKERQ